MDYAGVKLLLAALKRGEQPLGVEESDFLTDQERLVWRAIHAGKTLDRLDEKEMDVVREWDASTIHYDSNNLLTYTADLVKQAVERKSKALAIKFAEGAIPLPEMEAELAKLKLRAKKRTWENLVEIGKLFGQFESDGSIRTDVIPTGVDMIDTDFPITQGLIVLFAASGYGKTWLANQFSLHMAQQGKKVAYFSYEMSRGELLKRYADVIFNKRWNAITNEERSSIHFPNGGCLLVDDESLPTSDVVKETLPRMHAEIGGELDIVFVDNLSNMLQTKKSERDSIDYYIQEFQAISKSYRFMPIFIIAHSNR